METEKAFEILERATGELRGTRQDHQIIIEALKTIHKALNLDKPLETAGPTGEPSANSTPPAVPAAR